MCLFHQILCNIYLFSNLVDHLYFFRSCGIGGRATRRAVTNILGSGTEKILVTAGVSPTNNT
jgi:hypothetical protein